MTYLYSILSIVFGVGFIVFTYRTRNDDQPSFTVGYIMHLKGYIGGGGAILLQRSMLMQTFGWW
jgi:hypothetical protein